jgi:hypothetical protein
MLSGRSGPERQKAATGLDPAKAAEVSVCVKMLS